MVATLVALHLGLALIGRLPAEVTAKLGRPVAIERFPVRRDYRYRRLEVIFGDGRRVSAFLAAPTAPPVSVRATLAGVSTLHEARRYHCDAKGCFGTFFSGDGHRRVIYGLNRGRPYVGVQLWPS
jgi:hypothetical protein